MYWHPVAELVPLFHFRPWRWWQLWLVAKDNGAHGVEWCACNQADMNYFFNGSYGLICLNLLKVHFGAVAASFGRNLRVWFAKRNVDMWGTKTHLVDMLAAWFVCKSCNMHPQKMSRWLVSWCSTLLGFVSGQEAGVQRIPIYSNFARALASLDLPISNILIHQHQPVLGFFVAPSRSAQVPKSQRPSGSDAWSSPGSVKITKRRCFVSRLWCKSSRWEHH